MWLILILFERIIENRQQQLDQANTDHGMIFYLWFDELALQLRFNLISDAHERLPFGALFDGVLELEHAIHPCRDLPEHFQIDAAAEIGSFALERRG